MTKNCDNCLHSGVCYPLMRVVEVFSEVQLWASPESHGIEGSAMAVLAEHCEHYIRSIDYAIAKMEALVDDQRRSDQDLPADSGSGPGPAGQPVDETHKGGPSDPGGAEVGPAGRDELREVGRWKHTPYPDRPGDKAIPDKDFNYKPTHPLGCLCDTCTDGDPSNTTAERRAGQHPIGCRCDSCLDFDRVFP